MLLDDAHLAVSDFVTHDCRFIYDILSRLRASGCVECDMRAMKQVLPDEIFMQVEERGGYNELRRVTQNIDTRNFDMYLESIRKSNLLLKLTTYGFSVTRRILYHGKSIVPLDYFKQEQFTSDLIAQWYSNLIDETSIYTNNKVLEETTKFTIGEDFFDRIEAGEDKGIPFDEFDVFPERGFGKDYNNRCLSYFSNQINGIPCGFTMIGGYSNIGKTTLAIQVLFSMMHRGCRCMIITNEQRMKDFQLSFLTLLTYVYYKDCRLFPNDIPEDEWIEAAGITKSALKNNRLTPKQKEIAKKMQRLWDEQYADKLEFVSLEDSDTDLAVKKIKVAIASRGVTTCLYDTFKLDMPTQANNKRNMAEYLQLIQDSRKFEAVSRKYNNVQIMCTVQLAESTRGELFMTASVLSQSKQVKEVCDLMVLVRNTYPEELDCNNKKFFCHPYRDEYNQSTGKWERVEKPVDMTKVYRTVFIEKSRNSGNVSSDNYIAYLFTFDGNHGFWKDMYKCKPVQGHIRNK